MTGGSLLIAVTLGYAYIEVAALALLLAQLVQGISVGGVSMVTRPPTSARWRERGTRAFGPAFNT